MTARLPERTQAAPALTSWHDRLYVGWTGTDLRINVAVAAGGDVLQDKRRLPEKTYMQVRRSSDDMVKTVSMPVTLAGAADRLFVAWTTHRGDARVRSALDEAGELPVGRQRTGSGPALLWSARDGLILSWVGTDRRVNLLRLTGGAAAQPLRLDAARTDDRPSLCVYDRRLTLAWTGTDRRVNVAAVTGGRLGDSVRLDEARTSGSPAMCEHAGVLALAWTGTDRRVNVATVAHGRVVDPVRLDEARSGESPALCSHRGTLMLAWTGSDGHPNLRRVR